MSLSWRRRARRRGRPRSWPRTNAMAALLLPLKNWSQVLGLHTRRLGARVWEEISRWVRRGRSSTRSSPRVHLLRAMRLAREGCKSVLQPGLLSCFRNAEERRRCEVMEAALRPQKRGPRQRTSVSACRVRWEENATRRAALARACFCTPQVRLGSRKAAAKQVRIRASMVHSVFRLCVGVTRKQRSSAGMRRNCGLLSTIRLLRVAREGQGQQQQQQHPHPHPPKLHQQQQEAAAAARTRPWCWCCG